MVARVSVNPYDAPTATSAIVFDSSPWRRSGTRSLQLVLAAAILSAISHAAVVGVFYYASDAPEDINRLDRALSMVAMSHLSALLCASLALFNVLRMVWQIARSRSSVEPRFAVLATLGGLLGGGFLALYSGLWFLLGLLLFRA